MVSHGIAMMDDRPLPLKEAATRLERVHVQSAVLDQTHERIVLVCRDSAFAVTLRDARTLARRSLLPAFIVNYLVGCRILPTALMRR
jgi:hypothetical protein